MCLSSFCIYLLGLLDYKVASLRAKPGLFLSHISFILLSPSSLLSSSVPRIIPRSVQRVSNASAVPGTAGLCTQPGAMPRAFLSAVHLPHTARLLFTPRSFLKTCWHCPTCRIECSPPCPPTLPSHCPAPCPPTPCSLAFLNTLLFQKYAT